MPNKIYCAQNHDGYPVSIVIAPTKRDAELFWQGKDIFPFTVREIEPDKLGTPLGILEILKTRKIQGPNGPNSGSVVAVDR